MPETVNFVIYYKTQQNKFITSLKEANSYYKIRNALRKWNKVCVLLSDRT